MDNILNLLTNAKAAIEEVEMSLPNFELNPRHSCLDCIHWNQRDDLCDKYKMKPPATVIVRPEGKCTEFDDLGIPF
jgi:hypothetical protein